MEKGDCDCHYCEETRSHKDSVIALEDAEFMREARRYESALSFAKILLADPKQMDAHTLIEDSVRLADDLLERLEK